MALVVFELKFVTHLLQIVTDMETLTRERAILVTLDLIDMVLIANLVVMVVISGYETFISRLHMDDEPSVPAWMRHSTTGQLKLRIATTILLISTIHLLHAYLDPARIDDREAVFMIVSQVIFISDSGGLRSFPPVGPHANETRRVALIMCPGGK